jgi:hypothetical protein
MDNKRKAIEIITGRYHKGTPDNDEIIHAIFGKEYAEERFEIYFHWYNILHELGHGIVEFNSKNQPHPVDVEQLVNDFAVAFWLYYGEAEKLNEIENIVTYALAQIKSPARKGMTHIEYAKGKWGTKDLYNFNNYGWFQFSCVKASLYERKKLELVLEMIGIENVKTQPSKTVTYDLLKEGTVSKIIDDAVIILREWGVVILDVYVTFDNDPNRQMCRIVDL